MEGVRRAEDIRGGTACARADFSLHLVSKQQHSRTYMNACCIYVRTYCFIVSGEISLMCD